MADIQVTAVAKIVEGALEGDMQKVRAYAEHIARWLDESNEGRGARIIRLKLDGSYKNQPQIIVLDKTETTDYFDKIIAAIDGMTDEELDNLLAKSGAHLTDNTQ